MQHVNAFKVILPLTLVCLFSFLSANGQQNDTIPKDTTYWKKDFRGGLSFNQASFSENWQGGGVNSIGLNTNLTYKANYRKDIHSWDNTIDLGYGLVKNEDQGSRKSVDRLFLDTKYGRILNEKWTFFTSLTFLSQFDRGYEYDVEQADGTMRDSLISEFMSPAFITSSWGFEYHPVDYFTLRLGPFSPRLTVVNNDQLSEAGAYGVDPGDKTRFESLAFQMVADFNKDIAENLNLKWKYMMFANYKELEVKKLDHRLDLTLAAKVNKFIDVSVGGILLYDYDQIDELQISQALNLGLVYTYKNYKEKKK
ncbi:DUF3078 domain-containing protein [Fulvivirga sediminis]|uniref:DUF3078 domain-containing protein n=1 Tax=Fulvivirga sediminis TaxID=2803949 RepID=A0A937K1H7_9BACT|nr:DUF3078 domain-containing protein [Fulvivirga sediminis]MBL3656682.1 DUF3078 domain-containing protein [Fulvivirga sediminis]